MNPPIHAIAAMIEWKGKNLIVAAEDMETLTSYFIDQNHGNPEARHVALTLGPNANQSTRPHENHPQT